MTEEEQRELLKEWIPWLRKVATQMCRHFPQFYEDMMQEGWIAVWKAANEDRSDKTAPLNYWIKRCSMNRMKQMYNFWTAQCRDSRKNNLLDTVALWDTWGGTAHDDGREYDDSLWAALDVRLDAVEWAYHEGEIAQAVDRLPRSQRQYIIRKFWYCWDPTALDIYFDNARSTWNKAKRNLRKELAHLGAE